MNIHILSSIAITIMLFTVSGASAQSPQEQIDAIVQKIKPRVEVLDSANDLTLQIVLPQQYTQCLYASFAESRHQNNVAHSYLLEQIDFLVSAGLTTASIQSIIAYGHAMTNVIFASNMGKSIDKLEGDDFKERQKYVSQTFARLYCVNTFSDQRIQPSIRELIKGVRANAPR